MKLDLYEFLVKDEEEVRADIREVIKNYEFITFVGEDGELDEKMVLKLKVPALDEPRM